MKNKYKNNSAIGHDPRAQNIRGRKINANDRRLFEQRPRSLNCLQAAAGRCSLVKQVDHNQIIETLAYQCENIEHQIYCLRWLVTEKDDDDLERRKEFTRYFLDCLYAHHGVAYQGILFGSSVNGLGFSDSDIDMRLRPLVQISPTEFEPIEYNEEMVLRVLRDIAFRTACCSPAIGEFVPSARCPIAKLKFMNRTMQNIRGLEEGWKYDISLSTSSPLGSLNSHYIRFLCHIEPKFHYLTVSIKYWAKAHELIKSGRLSSYALINMMIFFCQNVDPPLLPTVNEMRDKFLHFNDRRLKDSKGPKIIDSITHLEWQCLMDLDSNAYERSKNTEPLCLLLVKFFEFYLKFPYSTNIITVRTGRPIPFDEFSKSPQYHRHFPLKTYLNVQDPFDLKHNTTSGMTGDHFMLLMQTMKKSYELLAHQINSNFRLTRRIRQEKQVRKKDFYWGLNSIFMRD